MSKERILIVGGGFGGVKAALELANNNHFTVTLLSDQPNLRYYPTLYHTATGGRRANSTIPLDELFKGKDITIAQGKAAMLDRKAKTITTDDGRAFLFDTLIISLGVVTNYFGIEGLDTYSYGIKSAEEAGRLKAHLHQQLIDDHKPDLNYVIIGAGPTGIELAGALPGYLQHIMKRHGVEPRKVHIDLIEALPRLLPRLPSDTSRMVKRRLKRLGVKLYLGQAVQSQSADELTINGKPVRSHTVIWTAGVTNHPFFKNNDFTLTKRGKVSVDAYLQAEDNIFVLGDNANTPYSGMAQTAIVDGDFHIIPLMKLEDPAQRATILPAMKEVDELVLKYKGSLSGEHNDGLVRGPWLEQMYGKEVLELFRQAKHIMDPDGIFNPHKKADADWDYSFGHIRDHF